MIRICFFNHFHNGDSFAVKQFMVDLSKKLPGDYSYTHFNHPKILSDLSIPYTQMPDFMVTANNKWPAHETSFETFIEHDGVLYINTWIGCYIDEIAPVKRGIIAHQFDINWKSYYRVWQSIYSELSSRAGVELSLEPEVEAYYPSIDYSKFDVTGYENFVKKYRRNSKILISNGPALSGQSLTNTDMSDILSDLAANFPKVAFICTKKFETTCENIFFTDDIQERIGSDMNEISYLSTYCDAIIGRNSGPFLFTNTRENLAKKTFVAFSRDDRECFPHKCSTKDFRYVRDKSNKEMKIAIEEVLKGLKSVFSLPNK